MSAESAGRRTTTPTTSTINADPYPTFRRLREEAPLYYNEQHDFFAAQPLRRRRGRPARLGDVQLGRGGILELIKAGVELPPGTLIFEDPPIHDIHRKLLSRVLHAAADERPRGQGARLLRPLPRPAGGHRPVRPHRRARRRDADAHDQHAARHPRRGPGGDPRAGRRQPAHRARPGDGGRGGRHPRPRHRDVRRLHRLARRAPGRRPDDRADAGRVRGRDRRRSAGSRATSCSPTAWWWRAPATRRRRG